MKETPQFLLKGPEVTPIAGEPYRYHVASSRRGEPEYLVDLEARFPATRCTCMSYECKKWPEFRKTLTADYCPHSRQALVVHALRHILATSRQLTNNHGE